MLDITLLTLLVSQHNFLDKWFVTCSLETIVLPRISADWGDYSWITIDKDHQILVVQSSLLLFMQHINISEDIFVALSQPLNQNVFLT